MQEMLPIDYGYGKTKVFGCKIDEDGKPVGYSDSNLMLDSRGYTVEFYEGKLSKYA